MSVKPLLFEIGCEELPAASLMRVATQLQTLLTQLLEKADLEPKDASVYATPRRIAVTFKSVNAFQPNRNITKRGPAEAQAFDAEGNPLPGALGFAKSNGTTLERLTRITHQGKTYLAFEDKVIGKPLGALWEAIMRQALEKIHLPKRMGWGGHDDTFLRPVKWLLAMHGDEVLKGLMFALPTRNITYGHWVLSKDQIVLKDADEYVEKLMASNVIADFAKRKATIRQQLEAAAATKNATAIIPDALLDEVTGLVEWPTCYIGAFDKSFLSVPKEALITSMQSHQKCFAMEEANGKMSNHFLVVANIQPENPAQIITGNERVVTARLEDARFFFEQDKRTPLTKLIPQLEKVTYQQSLGSMHSRVLRLQKISVELATMLKVDTEEASKAALLCKADLLTEMVKEFPELQGVMGAYYAAHHGESPAVAQAISGHYHPKQSKDRVPTEMVTVVVAIADRLETLCGIFGIGLAPTGEKDPFAVRRAALGLLKLIIENRLPLSIPKLLEMALATFNTAIDDTILPQLSQFIWERLKRYCIEQGYGPTLFEAVMATYPAEPIDVMTRLKALAHFVEQPEAAQLVEANKRVRNILKKAEISVFAAPEAIEDSALTLKEEIALRQAIVRIDETIDGLAQKRDYQSLLMLLVELKPAIDAFFENVMVMADEPQVRTNRISLLHRVYQRFCLVADISIINFG